MQINQQGIEVNIQAVNKKLLDKYKKTVINKEKLKLELSKVERQIKNCIDAVAQGLLSPALTDKLTTLENRKVELIKEIGKEQQAPKLLTKEDYGKMIRFLYNEVKRLPPDQLKTIYDKVDLKLVLNTEGIDMEFSLPLGASTSPITIKCKIEYPLANH